MTRKSDPSKYTDEVRAALAAQAPPPVPAPPPDGQVRYHIAVGTAVHAGTADPSFIAGVLRQLADHLDKENP